MEFLEVMRQARRMCGGFDACGECIARDYCIGEDPRDCDDDTARKFEEIVEDWAAEHPEPKYPTWKEWHGATFPNAKEEVCPCWFMMDEDTGCYEYEKCSDCVDRPIPADIAEKLGIKPKGGGENER